MSTLKYIVRAAWKDIQLASLQSKWRKKNAHNYTMPRNIFPMEKVSVGEGTYADLNVYSYRNPNEKLVIGNYCSIASDVIFVLSGEHNIHLFSTYPFSEKYLGADGTAICKGPIVVEDDVWMGVRVTVLSGVTIGRGAVIGAGSLVNKDVPPYSIYAGMKVIGKRFNEDICEKMMGIDFEKINANNIQDVLDKNINDSNVEEVVRCLKQNKQKGQY